MKRLLFGFIIVVFLSVCGIVWINSDLFAQENTKGQTVINQMQELKIEIPFVDRDGDGINDLLQSGWGLRFVERFKNRRAVWEQMMSDDEHGAFLVDTDGDGVPDTPVRDMMREHMNQLIDTDGDGVPDTPLRQHLQRHFQMFDQDGDGIPDEMTPEQIRQQLQEMRDWRQQIRQNIMNGLPAFTDENGDGIPDNLPDGFGWMNRRRGRG
ncbi:hypothetical protein ACFL6I_01200 [candidate division KSB1 bacterium]